MVSPSHATPTMPAMPPEGARLAADLIDVDLAVGASFRDHIPHEAFDELRRHGGIAWHAEPPVAGTMGDNPMLQFVDSRTEEHTSELQSLMRISYAVFCLKKKQK